VITPPISGLEGGVFKDIVGEMINSVRTSRTKGATYENVNLYFGEIKEPIVTIPFTEDISVEEVSARFWEAFVERADINFRYFIDYFEKWNESYTCGGK